MAGTDQSILDGKAVLQSILDTLNKVDQATATLQDIQGKISAYQSQAKSANDQYDQAKARLDGMNAELATEQAKVDSACAAKRVTWESDHAQKMASAQAELDTVNGSIATAKATLSSLETDINNKTEE